MSEPDPLEALRTKMRETARGVHVSVSLALILDIIEEIEDLREALDTTPGLVEKLSHLKDALEGSNAEITAQRPKVHGRPRLRPVSGDEGRHPPARDGLDSTDEPA